MTTFPCRVSWCDATHQDDTPTAAKHSKILLDSEIVTVVAHWKEQLNGRPSIGPLITVRSDVVSVPNFGLDLSPNEALELSGTLSALMQEGGVPEFAASLATGAEILAPHYDDTDEPLYVAGGEDQEGDK